MYLLVKHTPCGSTVPTARLVSVAEATQMFGAVLEVGGGFSTPLSNGRWLLLEHDPEGYGDERFYLAEVRHEADNWCVGWFVDRATFLALADAVFSGRPVDSVLASLEGMYGGPLR